MSDNVITPRLAVPLGSIVGADQCLSLLTVFLHPVDHSEQLGAIRRDISERREDERIRDQEIQTVGGAADKAESSYIGDALASHHTDLLYASAYNDAAQSMAAVGMLAPFVESLLCRYFLTLATMPLADQIIPPTHPRRRLKKEVQWDCHYTGDNPKRKNLVAGIVELSTLTGLIEYLPGDFRVTLTALYGYRNQMFHHGLEWPRADREKFARKTAGVTPEGWFRASTIDNHAWMFCMSDEFVDACLRLAESVLVAMNKHLAAKCSGADCTAWWTERLHQPEY